MSKRDKIHDAVKNALVKDGWTITADPFEISYKKVTLRADLAADRIIAAERGVEKIVVEIKSFLSPSPIHELQTALGQFELYSTYLQLTAPERKLYLAVSADIWERFFLREEVLIVVEKYQLPFLIVNIQTEEVAQWTK
ncbi:MAG: XisH family protein [Blastocatellia bacterium]